MIRRLLDRLGFGTSRTATPHVTFRPVPGQLVSVLTDDGQIGVVKLLAVDEGGVHARLYVQRFRSRPREPELGELSTAPFGSGHDNPFSIGHMPLSHASFAGWAPEPICVREVADDELEGYRMWQDAEAGYF
jgi:hypothetical protein